MKKDKIFGQIIILLLIISLIVINVICILIVNQRINIKDIKSKSSLSSSMQRPKTSLITDKFEGSYEVYQNSNLISCFNSFDEAVEYAKGYENAFVKKSTSSTILWDNTPVFGVYDRSGSCIKSFSDFSQALAFAKTVNDSMIFSRKSSSYIWENISSAQSFKISGVPLISQYPELHRGCEVTSLAMLMRYRGIQADKLSLADEITKCSDPKTIQNGVIYYANPNTGFVGDIYSRENDGYGVYHKPIVQLLKNYVGAKALDLTGCDFEDMYYYISSNCPIWIITNTKYKVLPESEFETWKTAEGDVRITYSEHSVVVIGYDSNYIYFNDPMDSKSAKYMPKQDFINAWIQMGRQAATITK